MQPLLHPSLVNGRFGDPALYVELLFERRALLFDIGDITSLPPRKIHRLEHVFVSHAHIDHFVGFDVMLRVLVGREKTGMSRPLLNSAGRALPVDDVTRLAGPSQVSV